MLSVDHKDLAVGLRLEKFLEKSFRRWGIFVARNPFSVMSISLLVSFALAMGMCFWKVTTDPVDLWVSSRSQARHDMEFFNQNFWKFYRIEQVVITPSNESDRRPFEYSYNNTKEVITETFGPVFKQSFLLEVFRLQQQLESLEAKGPDGQRITLQDICYKPLDKECATQSIFTYFLGNESLISDPDYINRIVVCTRYVFPVHQFLSLLLSSRD